MTALLNKAAASGDLVDIVALDRTGLFVTGEGAFVHVVEVTPCNPRVMSIQDHERISEAVADMCGRLAAGQSLQLYFEGSPERLEDVLADTREEIDRRLDGQPEPLTKALRWLARAHEQSLEEHSTVQAATLFRVYVVVPYLPPKPPVRIDWQDLLPGKRKVMPSAPLTRPLADHHRVVRESQVHTDAIIGDLEGMDLAARSLDGPEVFELLYRRFNPSSAQQGHTAALRVVGGLDDLGDARDAAEAAARLRGDIAESPISFADPRMVEVETCLERAHYVTKPPDATSFGWLMRAMETDHPFALSVHVHAVDREKAQTGVERRFTRTWGVIEGKGMRGRVPSLALKRQQDENERLIEEMSGDQQATVFDVGIYQTVREPGPLPDQPALIEASDKAIKALRGVQATAKHGGWMQKPLWLSTLPTGTDTAGHSLGLTSRYASRNVGDTFAPVGPSCGSPTGIPLFFSDMRTIVRIHPWDPWFANALWVINGKQGFGKTVCAQTIAANLLPHDVHVTVLDRSAGHWQMLTRLVPGAVHLSIGAENPEQRDATINPWDVPDPRRVSPEKIRFMRSLHELVMGELSADEKGLLSKAIRAVYAKCAEWQRQASERDLHAMLELLEAPSLALRLDRFVGDGEDAFLLDHPTTVPADSPLVVFNTKHAGEHLPAAMFIALEHANGKAERRMHNRMATEGHGDLFGGKSAWFLDEMWSLLKHPAVGQQTNEMTRANRHSGKSLFAITQHLSDLDNEHGLALLRSAQGKIFFGQAIEELDYVQRTMGLSDNAKYRIARLTTSRNRFAQAYLMNGPRGQGEVSLRLGGLMRWLTTSEPNVDLPLRTQVLAKTRDRMSGAPDIEVVWAALEELASMEGVR